MLRLVLAALFGLTLRGMASSKEAYDGNVIFENCQPGSSLASFCNGNLIGAIDVLITRGVVFCTPDGLTLNRLQASLCAGLAIILRSATSLARGLPPVPSRTISD